MLVLSVDFGRFDFLAEPQAGRDRFAVLVDVRQGEAAGRIVLHPYFADLAPVDPNDPRAASGRSRSSTGRCWSA